VLNPGTSGLGLLKKSRSINRKGRKGFRRGRKELNINILSLRSLRNPLRALRLKRLFQQPPGVGKKLVNQFSIYL
jgi:hypothetical protein